MSTPEHPDNPPLTRKQLRDLRNTGASTIVVPADAGPTPSEPAPAPPVVAPLPRAVVPAAEPVAPVPDATVDLGVAPLTRRQARQQERIRTASVPVITPEVIAAHAAATAVVADDDDDAEVADATDAEAPEDSESPADAPELEEHEPAVADAERAESVADGTAAGEPDESVAEEAVAEEAVADDVVAEEAERAFVNPLLGAGLLAGAERETNEPSFDQILARSATGAVGTSSALILTTTGDAPIIAPVAETGEMLVTGTLNLPEGLGSHGFPLGSADGKEVDAVLIDGELPAHSSPTPIAASAAISTVKGPGEVIRPPAPEKGNRLMMALAITAGVLALALVGVLILAFVTGVL